MIYVLEVPHQMPPSVWMDDESGIIDRVIRTIIQRRQDYELPKTLEEAIGYIGDDAHAHRVYMTDDEALRAYIDRDVPPHQAGESLAALKKALQRARVLDEHGLDDEAYRIALEVWKEQIADGLGEAGEVADMENIHEWLANRDFDPALLLRAAHGKVDALVAVRVAAGLPVFT
ncbi:MAG TPA: hypothetical protein VNK91_04420 [Burkholderiaceae bacterium]|nr:hypothetical protein [Burkholderiaceae bacterium]